MDVLGIGECMIQLDAGSDLAKAETFRRSVGGDVYNTLVAASRLGCKSAFLTKIASDGFGQVLMEHFEKENIDTRWVKQALKASNGLYFMTAKTQTGKRNDVPAHQFLYYRQKSAASMITPDNVTNEMIQQYSVVYASGITQALSPSSRKTVLKAFQTARNLGKLVCYDPNYRASMWDRKEDALDALIEVIPYVDVFFPSQEDLKELFNFPDLKHALEYFRLRGVNLVALKSGSEGVMLGFKQWQKYIDPPVVEEVVDTIGAGDAFNGGFIHGLVKGYSLEECANIGCQVAAESVQAAGPIAGLPTWEAVEKKMEPIEAGLHLDA